jgi:hypothetical protein
MKKFIFNTYLSKVACCVILVLTLASINVGQVIGAPSPSNVIVVNTPLPVREVDKPANQPFQAIITLHIDQNVTSDTAFFTVPAGKRLVIEFVSVFGSAGDGNKMTASFSTTVILNNGSGPVVTAEHRLVMFEQGQINDPVNFAAAQSMRVYADPATDVNVIIARTNPPPVDTSASATITISGYLIDVP